MYEDDSGVDWFEWVLLNGWIIIALLTALLILLSVLVKRIGDIRDAVRSPGYTRQLEEERRQATAQRWQYPQQPGWQTQPLPRQRENPDA